MAKRVNRSDVWDHFEKLSKSQVRCKICKKELAVAGGVTTGMHAHLRSKHPAVVEPSSTKTGSSASIARFVTQRSCPDSKQEKITTALARVITENLLPIAIVESDSLRELLQILEPQYKIPCRQTMTARLDSMQVALSSKLHDQLKTDVESLAITTDIWTSVSNEAYLSFTASYVDKDWNMRTPVLATTHMTERHTQAVIADHLAEIASHWEISEKISACVHDGAANVKDAGARNDWHDINCAAHKLQLCINSSMGIDKVTNHPISKCVAAASRLVGHFGHSPMATGELTKRQHSMFPDKQPLKLIQCCKTRWNSIYDMFARLVALRWPVCAVLSDRNVVKQSDAKALEMRDEHWQLMEELLSVLQPLQIATSVMSSETSPSASTLYPLLWGLLDDHLAMKDGDPTNVANFKRSVCDAIRQRFAMNDMNTATSLCVTATILDPKFKALDGNLLSCFANRFHNNSSPSSSSFILLLRRSSIRLRRNSQ